jgi:thioredoxin 1
MSTKTRANILKGAYMDLKLPALALILLLRLIKDIFQMTQNVSDSSFEQDVLKSPQPVIVDFWAEWCGPCRALGPLVDDLAKELEGKAKVVKMNIDENPNMPTKYGVRGIPTLMVFKNGELAETKVGGMSKSQLTDWAKGVI